MSLDEFLRTRLGAAITVALVFLGLLGTVLYIMRSEL